MSLSGSGESVDKNARILELKSKGDAHINFSAPSAPTLSTKPSILPEIAKVADDSTTGDSRENKCLRKIGATSIGAELTLTPRFASPDDSSQYTLSESPK